MGPFSVRMPKAYIKARVKQAESLYFRRFHRFTPDDVAHALSTLDIVPGDCVFVHSAYDAFRGFSGKPSDVIQVLKQAVGPAGALMMPTMPFTGTAVDYIRSRPIFDVRRTPSRMGLLTEVFRRSPGVLRSVHPTHPVAVWGKSAPELVAGHHLAATPCGRGTPFMRLLEQRGKIVFLGTGIEVMTFYHALEETLEDRLPFSPFTSEAFRLESRDCGGNLLVTTTRLFEPSVSRRRNLGKVVRELQRKEQWRQERAGSLSLIAFDAADVRTAVSEMAERGIYCYD